MEAYCLKCRAKREMKDATPDFNANGSPVTRGICPVCGTRMFKLGRTELHESLPKPAPRKPKEVVKSGKLVIVESPQRRKPSVVSWVRDTQSGHLSDMCVIFYGQNCLWMLKTISHRKYRVPNEKRPIVKELKELVKKSEEIFLATDPDREGEAIAWHLMEAAEIPAENSKRVVFHEITDHAISEAFHHPRAVNLDLVNAQQARRILDRLVGYSLSPLLWEKVRSRLSAGRVQSVALRLVVDREREIEAFIPQEYWSVDAEFKQEGSKQFYTARLIKVDGKDQQNELTEKSLVDPLISDLEKASYQIAKIKNTERRRKPSAPFITSTLQQEASRRLGYTARRTMALAQQLYEGIDVDNTGNSGLISYMRTDSTNIAAEAQAEARKYISQKHGSDFLPAEPPQYKTRAAGAQEAHEAIRPTSVFREPDQIKDHLSKDQYRLYQLIWQRFVASQMESAVYDTLTVEINGKGQQHQYLFRTSGSVIKFPGFLVVYEESADEDAVKDADENKKIPADLREEGESTVTQTLPRTALHPTPAALYRSILGSKAGRKWSG